MEAFSYFWTKGTIWINGKKVGEFLIKPREWQWFQFNFFDQAEILKVTIKPAETFVPKFDLQVRDNRTLGVAISEIRIMGRQKKLFYWIEMEKSR